LGSSCLGLPSAGITDMYHNMELTDPQGIKTSLTLQHLYFAATAKNHTSLLFPYATNPSGGKLTSLVLVQKVLLNFLLALLIFTALYIMYFMYNKYSLRMRKLKSVGKKLPISNHTAKNLAFNNVCLMNA
jgi:hypothetical protein